MSDTENRIKNYSNVDTLIYDVKNNFQTLLWGRDKFLDGQVDSYKIDAVLTVFGPSRWNPRVPHLSGWAIPHPLLPESPYFKMLSLSKRIKVWLRCILWKYMFGRSTDYFWTENPFISNRVKGLFPKKTVFSVTNYYNQVFDYPEKWGGGICMPSFVGITCLTITANYPHKNLSIFVAAARFLKDSHPDFNFRFALTIDKEDIDVPYELKKHFLFLGRVDVSECPHLYEQSDIMVMPSLLECFTATYPEAMKMEVPIVTTDLEFARGLCGDAACYYSAIDAKAAAEAIYKVATDDAYRLQLTMNGKEMLKKYDNYEQRAEKLIRILEEIA
jgi:glycosyltransferase involved in cell wall biosynthesis